MIVLTKHVKKSIEIPFKKRIKHGKKAKVKAKASNELLSKYTLVAINGIKVENSLTKRITNTSNLLEVETLTKREVINEKFYKGSINNFNDKGKFITKGLHNELIAPLRMNKPKENYNKSLCLPKNSKVNLILWNACYLAKLNFQKIESIIKQNETLKKQNKPLLKNTNTLNVRVSYKEVGQNIEYKNDLNELAKGRFIANIGEIEIEKFVYAKVCPLIKESEVNGKVIYRKHTYEKSVIIGCHFSKETIQKYKHLEKLNIVNESESTFNELFKIDIINI